MPTRRESLLGPAVLALAGASSDAKAEAPVRRADIGGGVALHYQDAGQGEPLILVHGSLGNLFYWSEQIGPFSDRFRTIAYSRRYNYPNTNAAIAGYSAIVDAQDLAALIRTLRLGPCHVVGHSYGAFTALVLAATAPSLVRTLTLAEPPAMSLLQHVPPPNAEAARALFADVEARMVAPMKVAFTEGRREDGVRVFIDYVLHPGAWDAMPSVAKAETLRDAEEWDVMLPTGELFPEIAPNAVRSIIRPTLILSGGKSYPFLGMIDQALLALLSDRRRLLLPTADHQMWLEAPTECRNAVLDLASAR